MDRRSLIRLGFAGAAAGIIAPRAVLAGSGTDPMKVPFAGTFYYTKDAPGRWSKKAGGHLPTFDRSGGTIEVTTGHPMKGYEHYIVKHMIFDEKFALVGETMFDPEKDAPVSKHCNIHDSWLNVLEI
jgi:superoxide reductase